MKTLAEVSANKVRGGFYSPAPLVRDCLGHVERLTEGASGLRVLEPGAGDGAFIRELASNGLAPRVGHLVALELLEAEAGKCRNLLSGASFSGVVHTASVIPWAAQTDELFDVLIGNPPYVRYQFVRPEDQFFLPALSARLDVPFGGVSNLWIPFLLGALGRLRSGGVFAVIIPTECFTGVSAGTVRQWLIQNTEELRVDLFPPGSYPGVLQEVLILSGRRRSGAPAASASLTVCQHYIDDGTQEWQYTVPSGRENWTKYLLHPSHLEAITEAQSLACVIRLGNVAKFEVAAVTGANEYFSVDEATANEFGLRPWCVPLLPRIRHARGLKYTWTDYAETLAAGARALLLDFRADQPDPAKAPDPDRYLKLAEELGIPTRYKCRIRDPWYRVPLIKPGRLMMSKRSHHYHRVIQNIAGVMTTDTIYRGWMLPGAERLESDFLAAFHNSFTLLTAELNGRSFGGGVLELVPNEISQLMVVTAAQIGRYLGHLDARLRLDSHEEGDGEALVDDTDDLLVKADIGLSASLMDRLRAARRMLLMRRLERN